MNLRRLTPDGIKMFSDYLDALEESPAQPLPLHLLTDAASSELASDKADIEPMQFGNRYNAAKYLDELFINIGLVDVERDSGLWSWLALYYFDELCPLHGSERDPGARARYIADAKNYQRYYRHLLAGPYRIYRTHRHDPEIAMAVLCQPIDKPGDIVEQFASRQELVTNPSVMAVATMLYVDKASQKQKRGSQTKNAGAARRLTSVLSQFDLTWDIYAMRANELNDILPKEFDKFRGRAG